MKTSKQMERHFKGIANHWRIEILLWIAGNPGATVEDITENLQAHFKSMSQHTQSLVKSGLIDKVYKGRTVTHFLSPYGKHFVRIIKEFQRLSTN